MPFDPDDLNKNNGLGKGPNNPGQDNDDFINSSFAVQFKPGDKSNSVADKIKQGRNDDMDDFDSFKDEFDDFKIDDTISAFKPLVSKEPDKSPFTSGKEEAKTEKSPEIKETEPVKKADSDVPAFPKNGGTFDRKPSDDATKGPDKSNTPVFGSEKDKTNSSVPQKKDEKLFNSGKDLDYATSEHDKNKSPFANATRPSTPRADKKPEVKTYGTVSSGVNAFASENTPEVGKESKAPSPFTIRPTPSPKPSAPKAAAPVQPSKAPVAQQPAAPSFPKAPAAQQPSTPAFPKAPQNHSEKPATPVAPVTHTAPVAAKTQIDKPAQSHLTPAAVKTQNEKPAQAKETPVAAKPQNEKPAQAEDALDAAKEQNEKPAQSHVAPAAVKTQGEKSILPHIAPAAAKVQDEKSSTPAQHTAPAVAKANESKTDSNDKETPVVQQAQRPGEAAKRKTPTLTKPAPTGAAISSIRPEDPRRMLASEKNQASKTASHEKNNISPVDTVKKTRKKKVTKSAKDPGIGGVITLIVIIFAFIAILLVLQNIDKIGAVFGRKTVETLPTIQTATTAATTAETPAATETETTAETTTEETTETTAETTTETTTEAATEETTAETTAATTKKASTGIATKSFSAKPQNFKRTSTGFKYDIVMVNKSGKTASFKKSLKSFNISIVSVPGVKSMSATCLKFKNKGGTWVGTPTKDFSIKPGGKLKITVNCKCGSAAEYYAYNSYNFKYN